ncbi:MAG: branched-chain amino acid aminotransferase [Calditrichia bacterium]
MSDHFKFEHLKFSLYEKAHEMKMYESYYKNGSWDEGRIVQYHNIELPPAANILNYGQGIFEGLKAYLSVKGKIVMFRPDQNARRFVRSAEKLGMAPVTEEKFLNAVRDVVLANEYYVPKSSDGKYTLYLRPVYIGIEELLGVRASNEYLFYIFASPVGPYFDKVGVVRLLVSDVHRAAPHGTGDAKAVSNYAVTMKPKKEARAKGYDDAIYLDPVHNKYVEEAGAANFFVLLEDDTLVTPPIGSILPGITRESIIRLAKDVPGIKVEERDVSIEEVCKNGKEVFLTGTAAIVTSVSEIKWNGEDYNVNKNDYRLANQLYDKLTGIQLQKEEDIYGWVHELA